MNLPRIVIAGTHSGVGKSTVSLGLMAAFRQRGLCVQSFKVGPDYIDPSYHTAITGRTSRNLDSWMLAKQMVRDIFVHAATDTDVSIVEGVMGFYDGKDVLSNEGSTAEISLLLNCPVLLVVDCSGMARSAAAIVKGYQDLDRRVNIAGVVANRVGGEGHFRLIQQAVEHECGIPVVGYLSKHSEIEIPERHLGLIPAIERGEHTLLLEQLSALASSTIDLDAVLSLAKAAPEIPESEKGQVYPSLLSKHTASGDMPKTRIAIARDAAFNFYYEENLELLEHYGAELVFFSPLSGEKIPEDAGGLYIGGGFPEEFAAQLSSMKDVRDDFREKIRNGLPTYAECGGYMYLTEQLTDLQGTTHDLVGLIPARVTMQKRLSGFGYREVTGMEENWLIPSTESARGHEFHYSTIEFRLPQYFAYEASGSRWSGRRGEGYSNGNLVAGYTHLHFASNPLVVEKFVERCRMYRAGESGRQAT